MSNFQGLDDLNDSISDLNAYLHRSRIATGLFMRQFSNFSRDSRDFFRNWRNLLKSVSPGSNTTGGGGAGRRGGGRSTNAGDSDQPSKVFQSYLNSAGNAMIRQVQAMDDLQARAMATNTTLEKMNIPGLGIRMSKLAGEILDLREEGFKNLNKSTLGLMSTMKLTGQNTASLKGFLANTSLNLRLNSTQVQKMATQLGETAVSFGMSQDKIFQAVNKLSQSISTASLFGKGGQTAAALGEVAAMVGDRATEELAVVADFLTGIGNESQSMIAGIFDIQNRFLAASKEEQTKLTLEAIKIFNQQFRARTAGIGTDNAGRRMIDSVVQQFGGMQNVRAFQSMETALQDASQKTNQNTQTQDLIRNAQEKYADQMERVANQLETLVTKLPGGTMGAIGTGLGVAQSVAGTVGTVMVAKGLMARLGGAALVGGARGAMGGPWGVALGALVGLAGTLLTIKSFSQQTANSTDETKNAVDKTNQILNPNKETEQTRSTYSLIDSINNMVSKLGPQTDTTNKQSLEVQREMVNKLTELNQNVAARQMQMTAQHSLSR